MDTFHIVFAILVIICACVAQATKIGPNTVTCNSIRLLAGIGGVIAATAFILV